MTLHTASRRAVTGVSPCPPHSRHGPCLRRRDRMARMHPRQHARRGACAHAAALQSQAALAWAGSRTRVGPRSGGCGVGLPVPSRMHARQNRQASGAFTSHAFCFIRYTLRRGRSAVLPALLAPPALPPAVNAIARWCAAQSLGITTTLRSAHACAAPAAAAHGHTVQRPPVASGIRPGLCRHAPHRECMEKHVQAREKYGAAVAA